MKKLLKISTLFLFFGVMYWNCTALSESDKVVEEFYNGIKTQKYDKIVSMLDTAAIAINPPSDWTNMFSDNQTKLGNLKNFSKTSFKTTINDGVSKTVMDYTVEYEKNTTYERFIIVERSGIYKILSWEFNTDKSSLETGK